MAQSPNVCADPDSHPRRPVESFAPACFGVPGPEDRSWDRLIRRRCVLVSLTVWVVAGLLCYYIYHLGQR